MNIKALIIKPKDKVSIEEISIKPKRESDVLVKWDISSVCNSERRRFNFNKVCQ